MLTATELLNVQAILREAEETVQVWNREGRTREELVREFAQILADPSNASKQNLLTTDPE